MYQFQPQLLYLSSLEHARLLGKYRQQDQGFIHEPRHERKDIQAKVEQCPPQRQRTLTTPITRRLNGVGILQLKASGAKEGAKGLFY